MEHDEKCEKNWMRLRLAMDHNLTSTEWSKLEEDQDLRLCYCLLRFAVHKDYGLSEGQMKRLVDVAVEKLNYFRGEVRSRRPVTLDEMVQDSVDRYWHTVKKYPPNVIAVDFRNRRKI